MASKIMQSQNCQSIFNSRQLVGTLGFYYSLGHSDHRISTHMEHNLPMPFSLSKGNANSRPLRGFSTTFLKFKFEANLIFGYD